MRTSMGCEHPMAVLLLRGFLAAAWGQDRSNGIIQAQEPTAIFQDGVGNDVDDM